MKSVLLDCGRERRCIGVIEGKPVMIFSDVVQVYVSRDRVDLRKSYEGLGMLVQQVLCLDPLSGHLFVFFNKALDKVKVLYWQGGGLCLWQKRLERGRFQIKAFEQVYWSLSFQDFHLLLAGVDLRTLPMRPDFRGRRLG